MAKNKKELINRIIMKGMKFSGHIGVGESEHQQEQPVVVDVILYFRKLKARYTDSLADTTDYAAVFETIRKIIEDRSFNLVESMAATIAGSILDLFERVDSVKVSVKKPEAPINGTFNYMAACVYEVRSKKGKKRND